ncbi:MAG: hypothetical protein ABR562_00945 [Thermoplasmatota archaeon]
MERTPAPLIVKVGGSLLPGREGYAAVAAALAPIIARRPLWIVVSAAKGVTDALESLGTDASRADAVLRLHEVLFGEALPDHLTAWFRTAQAAAEAGAAEALMAWGEQASAEILRRHLADLGHGLRIVELAPSVPAPDLQHAIVPGFYVRGAEGAIQLLPRGGSDVSAVMAARWLGAAEVRLWKQGGGIRLEPGVTVRRVDAATLLAWLGDRVRPIHPAAVRLAQEAGVALTLEDPRGIDGLTRIDATATAIPPPRVPDGVAGEASP